MSAMKAATLSSEALMTPLLVSLYVYCIFHVKYTFNLIRVHSRLL